MYSEDAILTAAGGDEFTRFTRLEFVPGIRAWACRGRDAFVVVSDAGNGFVNLITVFPTRISLAEFMARVLKFEQEEE